jgi:hypothetical protein
MLQTLRPDASPVTHDQHHLVRSGRSVPDLGARPKGIEYAPGRDFAWSYDPRQRFLRHAGIVLDRHFGNAVAVIHLAHPRR